MKPLLMNAQLNKLIQQCVASQLNKDPYNKQRNKPSEKRGPFQTKTNSKATL